MHWTHSLRKILKSRLSVSNKKTNKIWHFLQRKIYVNKTFNFTPKQNNYTRINQVKLAELKPSLLLKAIRWKVLNQRSSIRLCLTNFKMRMLNFKKRNEIKIMKSENPLKIKIWKKIWEIKIKLRNIIKTCKEKQISHDITVIEQKFLKTLLRLSRLTTRYELINRFSWYLKSFYNGKSVNASRNIRKQN